MFKRRNKKEDYQNLLDEIWGLKERVAELEELPFKEELERPYQEPSDELKQYIRQCVYKALDNWVFNKHHEVVTTLDGKRIETKYVNDARRELQAKKLDLERILEYVDGELDKYKGENDAKGA